MPANALSRNHRMRLMQIWRSAGWPCQDAVEIELLAAGLVRPHVTPEGHEQLRLTALAIDLLAQERARNARAASLHDRIEHRFTQQQLLPAGRIVWRELALRAALDLIEPVPEPAPEQPSTVIEDLFWSEESATDTQLSHGA